MEEYEQIEEEITQAKAQAARIEALAKLAFEAYNGDSPPAWLTWETTTGRERSRWLRAIAAVVEAEEEKDEE